MEGEVELPLFFVAAEKPAVSSFFFFFWPLSLRLYLYIGECLRVSVDCVIVLCQSCVVSLMQDLRTKVVGLPEQMRQ